MLSKKRLRAGIFKSDYVHGFAVIEIDAHLITPGKIRPEDKLVVRLLSHPRPTTPYNESLLHRGGRSQPMFAEGFVTLVSVLFKGSSHAKSTTSPLPKHFFFSLSFSPLPQ